MMPKPGSRLLFADSNVFIEDLFIKDSAASLVMDMVAAGSYMLCTCKTVFDDVERIILHKLRATPDELDRIVADWHKAQLETKLQILPDAPPDSVRRIFAEYMALVRHKNDIPILACILETRPDVVLSGNREHFNDKVQQKQPFRCSRAKSFFRSFAVI